MKREILGLVLATVLAGCASTQQGDVVQASMPMRSDSATPGAGNTVMSKGRPVSLGGSGVIEVGKPMPSIVVADGRMSGVDLSKATGKVRIISVVPSIDTATCEAQTHQLSEDSNGLDKQVDMIAVSRDLPFAQQRFAREAKISNVVFLSDANSRQFGEATGLTLVSSQLLARAVIVTDQKNIVRYLQVVPDINSLPDIQQAMRIARGLL